MQPSDAVGQLVRELASDPDYGTGAKPFPRRVEAAEAEAFAAHIHKQVDIGVSERNEQAVADKVVIACGRGCNACCEQLVMIYLPEAVRVAGWLNQPEQAEVKAAFLAAYPKWKEQIGDLPEQMGELAAAGQTKEHLALHVAAWRKRILCAFNRSGDCSIYPVRPVLCRNCHAVDTADHCRADDPTGIPVKTMHFEPLENFVRRARAFLRAGQHAMGGPINRPQALCQTVYELLCRS